MSIFDFLRRGRSASVAKERLMMVLSYERKGLPSGFRDQLQKDLIHVFEKYPQFNVGSIEINFKAESNKDEISISIPFKNNR
jgi:cell division topological specificity factor